jgi:diacylglycerol kinase
MSFQTDITQTDYNVRTHVCLFLCLMVVSFWEPWINLSMRTRVCFFMISAELHNS